MDSTPLSSNRRMVCQSSLVACNSTEWHLDQPVVARVSIVYGKWRSARTTAPITNVAVMDDFNYGEPEAAPH
ncbi:MAG: hypothetical protein JOZ65_23490 [Chloroflexi bacterium]|nr:hypothetical protein [Chloroflexota bacterium]